MINLKYYSVLLGVVFVHCAPNGTSEEQIRHGELKNGVINNSTKVAVNNVTEAEKGNSITTINKTTLENISSTVKPKRRVLIVNSVQKLEKVKVNNGSSKSTSAERRNGNGDTDSGPSESGSENGKGSDASEPGTADEKDDKSGNGNGDHKNGNGNGNHKNGNGNGNHKNGNGNGKHKGVNGEGGERGRNAGRNGRGGKVRKGGKKGKGGKGKDSGVHTLLYQEYNDANEILNEYWMRNLEDVVKFFELYLDTTICHGECTEE